MTGMQTPYDDAVRAEASRQGIDPNWAVSIMHAESAGRKGAVSPAGASGLMQLMPNTAKELGVSDIFDPEQNIRGGVAYLKQTFDASNGDLAMATARYNAGVH